ncbi:DNA cytosine methyltransferase [Fusibacter bizertensis]
MKQIPIFSFFSGAGFLDLGFHIAGFDIIYTNEISKEISKIYESGMSSCLCKKVNITSNESIELITSDDLRKVLKDNKIEEMWGIIGGPPCPDFSIGGKNKGKDGDKGKLTETYVNLICDSKPTFFVLENVKGLVKTKKHKLFFDEMVCRLEENGYAIDFKLLNALDLGIPQDRERIFVIGVKKNIYSKIFYSNYEKNRNWFYWPYYEKYYDAKKKYSWPSIDEFGANIEKPNEIPSELMVGTYIIDQNELSKLANSDEYFTPKSNKFIEINEGDDKRKSFKRLHRWKYSPTAAYGNNEVHLHPTLARRLSVREALRIQSVPDRYIISKDISLTTKFKAIGNGVPVKMASIIASNLNYFLNIYLYSEV